MSIKKKVVWLPYDMDTSIGINNEGSLVFSYNLEDIDQTEGGADVFNGQDSVLWKNIRAAFFDELKAMYQNLRSTGVLSYSIVEEAFEAHQAEWGEAIFNEDAYFKYLAPLIEDGSGAYLAMLQGSKAEQRKWWLYNRFRYIDSKYNAGDSLSDVIQIRGYAKSDVTVTPYADVYATVKYGSYLVQTRAQRNNAYTLPCPLDNVNDTEIYIYSASQLADVGDLSGFKVGYADFSMGTKLQSIKLGDSSQSYSNGNMQELYLGNNILLRTLDVRNCPNLGRGDMKSVDISGCKNIENVYFDGTAITGVELPVGGILKKLHLPATVTNLTIRDQPSITEFSIPSYSSISTLWLDNVSSAVDEKAILRAIPASSRVRVMNFYWEVTGASEIGELFDILDTMRGLDEHGGNMDTAQLGGTIHTSSLTGDEIAAFNARYPYITVIADHVTSYLYYKTWDGSETLKRVDCYDGVPSDMTAPEGPVRPDTTRNIFTFVGWSTHMDASTAETGYLDNVIADRVVYAAYSRITMTYLTYNTWDGSETLKTVRCVEGVPDDSTAPAGPTRADTDRNIFTFVGWNTQQDASTAETDFLDDMSEDKAVYAAYSRIALTYLTYKTWDGETTLKTVTCRDGVPVDTTPPAGPARANTETHSFTFVGWNTAMDASVADSNYLDNVTSDRIVYAAYSRTAITHLTYMSYDGTTTYKTVTCINGVPQESAPANPTRTSSEQYDYTFAGWSRTMNSTTAESDAQTGVNENRVIYAVFTASLRNYTATFVKASADGGGTLYTHDFAYGTTPTYGGATPTSTQGTAEDYPFEGWSPALGPIYANTTYTAKFGSPVQDVEITDSWDTIIANIDNGTYKTAYKIGNYKPLDLGTEGIINMQIVAMDEDDLASGGKAPLTFIGKELLTTSQKMNNSKTTSGGYEASAMRSYLTNTILPLVATANANVAARIQRVNKIQSTYNGSLQVNGQTTVEKIWIPSHHEVGLGTNRESIGAIYNKVFKDNSSRIKSKVNTSSASWWWLRSALASNSFGSVNSDGSNSSANYYANSEGGVVVGFCLGLEAETITDSWSEIFAAEQDGTYSTKYSIGDTKSIDLGTEGVHLMEIVAFDTDDRADGQGKAKITWISKDLLPTAHRMNPARNGTSGAWVEGTGPIGGWAESEMRSYLKNTIKPLIPSNVRDAIVNVSKYSKSANTSGEVVNDVVSTDDVWIPSFYEIGGSSETQGAKYNTIYYDSTTRKKRRLFSDYGAYWTRSVYNSLYFYLITVSGSNSHTILSEEARGIILGFCT